MKNRCLRLFLSRSIREFIEHVWQCERLLGSYLSSVCNFHWFESLFLSSFLSFSLSQTRGTDKKKKEKRVTCSVAWCLTMPFSFLSPSRLFHTMITVFIMLDVTASDPFFPLLCRYQTSVPSNRHPVILTCSVSLCLLSRNNEQR